MNNLILSLFPGIDIMGKGFEAEGYCVVRGPDLIFGGDIRTFHPPAGTFTGIIGGPPCQQFSKGNPNKDRKKGLTMLIQFARCITQAQPDWWVMENVPSVPNLIVQGYQHQRIDMQARDFGLPQSRIRHIQYGYKTTGPLIIPRQDRIKEIERCCIATEANRTNRRGWTEFCQLQGLPKDFKLPGMTKTARYRAVGNAFPSQMSQPIAHAIKNNHTGPGCICGCGRPRKSTRSKYGHTSCRVRRKRQLSADPIEELHYPQP